MTALGISPVQSGSAPVERSQSPFSEGTIKNSMQTKLIKENAVQVLLTDSKEPVSRPSFMKTTWECAASVTRKKLSHVLRRAVASLVVTVILVSTAWAASNLMAAAVAALPDCSSYRLPDGRTGHAFGRHRLPQEADNQQEGTGTTALVAAGSYGGSRDVWHPPFCTMDWKRWAIIRVADHHAAKSLCGSNATE